MTKKEQLPAPTGHHNLILEDRAKLTLTGVTDVDCFDERMINLFTGLGELTIKGRNLHINDVSVETGDMTITGDICCCNTGKRIAAVRCPCWESCSDDAAGNFFHRAGTDTAADLCGAAGDPAGRGVRCAADAPAAASPRQAGGGSGRCGVPAAVGGSTALFFHRAGTGRIPRLLCHGQRTGIFAVPLYAGLRHSAPSGTGPGGDFRQFAAAVSPAFPRCCAYLHSVAPEIWTFRQTFSKSIFFFAFTLAER